MRKQSKKKLYYIESILDQQIKDGSTYYLVKWDGYPMRQATWELAQKVPDSAHYLKEYYRQVREGGPKFYYKAKDKPPSLEEFLGQTHQKGDQETKDIEIQLEDKKVELNDQLIELRCDIRRILQVQNDILVAVKKTLQASDLSEPPIRKKILTSVTIQTDQPLEEKPLTTSPSPPELTMESPGEQQGSFEVGDVIERIGQAVQVRQTGIRMYYVLWKKRANGEQVIIGLGVQPRNTWMESDYLKKYDAKSLCLYLRGKVK